MVNNRPWKAVLECVIRLLTRSRVGVGSVWWCGNVAWGLQILTFVRKWDGVSGDFNTTILLILAAGVYRWKKKKYSSRGPGRVDYRFPNRRGTRERRGVPSSEIDSGDDRTVSVSPPGQEPPSSWRHKGRWVILLQRLQQVSEFPEPGSRSFVRPFVVVGIFGEEVKTCCFYSKGIVTCGDRFGDGFLPLLLFYFYFLLFRSRPRCHHYEPDILFIVIISGTADSEELYLHWMFT